MSATRQLRPTGIPRLERVPWGTHVCQFYQTPEDLLEILVEYFRAGLQNDEYCMWVTSPPVCETRAMEAIRQAMPDFDAYLARGQIEIIPHDQWYVQNGAFDASRVLDGWVARHDRALANGYAGLRLTGNTFWLEPALWESFTEYEARINRVIGQYRMLALCTYSLARCSLQEVLDVVSNHQFALIKEQGKWRLIESSEHREKTRQLEKLNRTLRARGDTTQALLHAGCESDLLQEICRIVVEDCGHPMVWIGYREDDPGKTIRPVAHAGFEAGYLETLNITWADDERGHGPTGTAVRTGAMAVCRDVQSDPLFAPWREQALQRGIQSCIVLPLLDAGRAFGALTIYSPEPDPFSDDEVELLAELANHLAFGITGLRLRDAHAEAEAALRQSESQYRNLFNSMSEGFALHEIICDANDTPVDYRFLDINPAFEHFTGLHREDVVGKTVQGVLPGNDPYWIQIYGQVALTGQAVHFDNYSSALQRHYEVFAYSPAPRRFATIFVDITERKQMEATLRDAMQNIQQLNAVLEQRASELQVANRELEAFTYSVSHDLRAPLSSIGTFANLLWDECRDALPDDGRLYLQLIRDNSASMTQLMEGLLAFSRSGRRELVKQTVDPAALVRKVLTELSPTREHACVHVAIGDLPPCEADPVLLKQVWTNLLANAFKFTRKQDAPRVTVGCAVRDGEKVYFCQDNGVGFDMTQSGQLFGVFQRLHHADEYEGNGVGLAIVERIIRRHGGRVWAQAEVGSGATFYFTLA